MMPQALPYVLTYLVFLTVVAGLVLFATGGASADLGAVGPERTLALLHGLSIAFLAVLGWRVFRRGHDRTPSRLEARRMSLLVLGIIGTTVVLGAAMVATALFAF